VQLSSHEKQKPPCRRPLLGGQVVLAKDTAFGHRAVLLADRSEQTAGRLLALGRAQLERQHHVREAAEQGEEPDPDQQ